MSRNNITSFWQSAIWADILSSTGQAEVIPYTSGNMRILIERRKIWKHTTGLYILGIDDDHLTQTILDDISHTIVSPSDLFLQIEPKAYFVGNKKEEISQIRRGERKHREGIGVLCSLDKEHVHRRLEGHEGLKNKKKAAPFRRFLEPTTAILPLVGMTEDSLLSRFEEKGRYNVRVAMRRGVTTHWVSGESLSPYSLPGTSSGGMTNTELFFSLLQETTGRNNFAHNNLSYYQHFIAALEKNTAGGLLFATKDTTLHAAGVFVYTENQGIYYYGASPDAPEIRRDHGTYLLQWKAMCEALHRGCSEYDFLGISSHPGDKLAGVTAFKMRFAPDIVSLPPETVVIFRPFLLKIFRIIRLCKKILQQYRRK